MKKVLAITMLLAGTTIFAQKASDKAVKQTCDCVKKIDQKLPMEQRKETAMKCMEDAMIANYEGMLTQYKIKEKDAEKAGAKLGEKFGLELVQGCPDIIPYFMDEANETQGTDINTDTLKLEPKVCALYKSGQYVPVLNFVNKKAFESPDKTAYTEVKGNMVLDYSESGKKVTKWTIAWTSDCEWVQTFVESNDAELNALIKKGDKITVKAIGSSGNNLWINTTLFGMDMIMLVKKK